MSTQPPRRFRKKPIEVEAMRWVSQMDDSYVQRVFDWLRKGRAQFMLVDNAHAISITTLEGEMRADDGDWIVKGIKGEFYPCKPDIFDATYEPAREAEGALDFGCTCEYEMSVGTLEWIDPACPVHNRSGE